MKDFRHQIGTEKAKQLLAICGYDESYQGRINRKLKPEGRVVKICRKESAGCYYEFDSKHGTVTHQNFCLELYPRELGVLGEKEIFAYNGILPSLPKWLQPSIG